MSQLWSSCPHWYRYKPHCSCEHPPRLVWSHKRPGQQLTLSFASTSLIPMLTLTQASCPLSANFLPESKGSAGCFPGVPRETSELCGGITGPGTLTPSSAPFASMPRFAGALREVVAPFLPPLESETFTLYIYIPKCILGFAVAPLDTVSVDGKGSRKRRRTQLKRQRSVPASAQANQPRQGNQPCDWACFLPLYPNACTLCWESFLINRAR